MIKLIVAVNQKGYIGKNNQLLFNIPSDMARFKYLTTGHTVVMGRMTWESIPRKFRPLPERHNVILTKDEQFNPNTNADNVEVIHDLKKYLKSCYSTLKTVWVIGGESVYRESLRYVQEIHISVIEDSSVGDVSFPMLPKGEFVCQSAQQIPGTGEHPGYTYMVYVRRTQ